MTSELNGYGGFDESSWKRLQHSLEATRESTTNLDSLREKFETGGPSESVLASELVVNIQEIQLKTVRLREKIESMQKLIVSKRRLLVETNEKLARKQEEREKLAEKAEASGVKLVENEKTRVEKRRYTKIVTRMGAYRKAHLIQEIVDLFQMESKSVSNDKYRPNEWMTGPTKQIFDLIFNNGRDNNKIDGGPASLQQKMENRECKCLLYDTIRGLHLPNVNQIMNLGHSDTETAAALGYFIHALVAICEVLGYDLRYPVTAYSSMSKISNPGEEKDVPFFGWRKKLDRDRFFEGLQWLGKNLAQLRSDCGIPTPMADKTLSILVDWARSVTGGKHVSIYKRPTGSAMSPSCLLSNQETYEKQV